MANRLCTVCSFCALPNANSFETASDDEVLCFSGRARQTSQLYDSPIWALLLNLDKDSVDSFAVVNLG